MSKSGSVTSSNRFSILFLEEELSQSDLAGIALILLIGLSSNLVFLACLLGLLFSVAVSEIKD